MDTAALRAPFDPARVSWRVGSTKSDKSAGLALAYIDARDVMDRLDEVCGPRNWQDRYEFHGARTVCYLSIRIGEEWITKADGAGDSDVEAEKGSISDALKRAAVKWGIGRYLYELPKVWVDLKPVGKSFAIADGQDAKLARALGVASKADQPAPAKPTISERAAPKAPAPKHEPEVLGRDTLERIEATLIQAIDQQPGLFELNTWARSQDNRDAKASLPPEGQTRVSQHFNGRKAELERLAMPVTL